MALLGMIQTVCKRIGITVPTTVVGNTDNQIIQLLAIADEEGEDLGSQLADGWEAQRREATFTMVAGEDQGVMNGTVVAAGDFRYIINETLWNRTTSLPIIGPVSSAEWETLQAFPVTGPYEQWQIRNKNFRINPAPAGGDTMAFQYMSDSFCETTGMVGQNSWQNDTDTGLLSESLMTLGIRWRWLKTKGLEYAEDFNTYERRVTDAMARDGGAGVLNLGSGNRDYRQAGIIIPIGSWNL